MSVSPARVIISCFPIVGYMSIIPGSYEAEYEIQQLENRLNIDTLILRPILDRIHSTRQEVSLSGYHSVQAWSELAKGRLDLVKATLKNQKTVNAQTIWMQRMVVYNKCLFVQNIIGLILVSCLTSLVALGIFFGAVIKPLLWIALGGSVGISALMCIVPIDDINRWENKINIAKKLMKTYEQTLISYCPWPRRGCTVALQEKSIQWLDLAASVRPPPGKSRRLEALALEIDSEQLANALKVLCTLPSAAVTA